MNRAVFSSQVKHHGPIGAPGVARVNYPKYTNRRSHADTGLKAPNRPPRDWIDRRISYREIDSLATNTDRLAKRADKTAVSPGESFCHYDGTTTMGARF